MGAQIHDPLKPISDYTFLLVELTNRNKANLPDKMDVNHAARGLVKLWSTYRYVQNIIYGEIRLMWPSYKHFKISIIGLI